MSFQHMEQDRPTILELNSFETALMLHKLIAALGMANFGTKEERKGARKLLKELSPYVQTYVSAPAFRIAMERMGLCAGDMDQLLASL